MSRIRVDRELRDILLRVAMPGRYTGGEYGSVVKEDPALLRVAVSYPDLYEIGMSNLAVRLLYRLLNSLPGVSCERVFAPAPDFEVELRARRLPLFSLETGRPLREFDILGFSVGYELTLTNLLNILDTGGVSLFGGDRGEGEPIVLAGGPAVTNPLPFGRFVDAVFIGEAERWAAEAFPRLAELKRRGACRADLLEEIRRSPSVWYPGKSSRTRRAVWPQFAGGPAPDGAGGAAASAASAPFPVSNIKAVQDQGVVEIMRGCPHGCRFCHAGILYRPFRLREPSAVVPLADELVYGCGYREITLSSLSSADYPGIGPLVERLNDRYREQRVSFSLPSLRISSMTMELMAGLSEVRKSGLTFAVETPLEEWQRGLNKEASLERTIALLQEARQKGWRQAKFYFMVGLPVAGGRDESGPIVDFLERVQRETRMNLNANVACFIPKPHTPFQWAGQLTEREGLERIMAVKRGLAHTRVKVGYHAPFLSLLEGIISRGDERAGELAWQAFRRGARLDAWEEHIDWDLWRGLIRECGWDVEGETCRPRGLEERLPWEGIDLGVSAKFLRGEWERALRGERTAACRPACSAPCGACGREAKVKDPAEPLPPEAPEPPDTAVAVAAPPEAPPSPLPTPSIPPAGAPAAGSPVTASAPPASGADRRVLFSFAKEGRAVFLSHLNVMGIFERALARAGYRACFTEGFNPKPRLEFASPLPLGLESRDEIASVELKGLDSAQEFIERMNRSLPEGLRIQQAKEVEIPRPGRKRYSLMSLFWGADYRVQAGGGTGEVALRDLGSRLEEARQILASSASPSTEQPPAERQGNLARLAVLNGSVDFRLRQSGAESSGVLRFLKAAGGLDPLVGGLRITRLATLARDTAGEPLSYFDRL